MQAVDLGVGAAWHALLLQATALGIADDSKRRESDAPCERDAAENVGRHGNRTLGDGRRFCPGRSSGVRFLEHGAEHAELLSVLHEDGLLDRRIALKREDELVLTRVELDPLAVQLLGEHLAVHLDFDVGDDRVERVEPLAAFALDHGGTSPDASEELAASRLVLLLLLQDLRALVALGARRRAVRGNRRTSARNQDGKARQCAAAEAAKAEHNGMVLFFFVTGKGGRWWSPPKANVQFPSLSASP